MDFTHANQGSRKSGKFVLVAALHVALGFMFVNGMNVRRISVFDEPIILVNVPPPEITPPTPVELPKVETHLPPPTVFVPVVETPVIAPPDQPTIVATTDHPVAKVTEPGPVIADQPPVVTPPARPPAMHTAVLADANACTLPAYPKNSIRNEETGTTTLALLVGTDGRVTSARVEQSSGYRELDRAAVQALSLCQFKPATNNGAPEAGWAKLAYVWRLD